MTIAHSQVRSGTYQIDTARSQVAFVASHLWGVGQVHGSFRVREGTVHVAEGPETTRIDAVVDLTTFKTDKAKRDSDVLSKRFLDAANYPDLRFTGVAATGASGGGVGTVDGLLDRHGHIAPATISVVGIEVTDEGLVATATARVDRTKLGVSGGRPIVNRWLDLTLRIVLTRSL